MFRANVVMPEFLRFMLCLPEKRFQQSFGIPADGLVYRYCSRRTPMLANFKRMRPVANVRKF